MIAMLVALHADLHGRRGQVHHQVWVDRLNALRSEFIPNLDLHNEAYGSNPAKRQRLLQELDREKSQMELMFETEYDRKEAVPRDPPVSGETLNPFVHQTLEHSVEEATEILKTIAVEAEYIHVDDYPAMLFPFLEQLAKTMNTKDSMKWNKEVIHDLFCNTLVNHLRRYVGMEPVPPRDYRRSPVGRGHCFDCKALDTFALDPFQKIRRFPIGARRRYHLSHVVERSADLAQHTDCSGNSYTLVVTKTEYTFEAAKKDWCARVAKAERHLRRLEELIDLKSLLGDCYNNIAKQSIIRLPPETSAPTLPQQESDQILSSAPDTDATADNIAVSAVAPSQTTSDTSSDRPAKQQVTSIVPTKSAPLVATSGNARPDMREVSRRISAFFAKPATSLKRKAEEEIDFVDLTVDK